MVLADFHPLHARGYCAVPPPFIRRCGERGENSKFVIVFISITMATKVHGKGQLPSLIRGEDDLALHQWDENHDEVRRRDDLIRRHFLYEYCLAKEGLGRIALH